MSGEDMQNWRKQQHPKQKGSIGETEIINKRMKQKNES